jgi:hypothetical protein
MYLSCQLKLQPGPGLMPVNFAVSTPAKVSGSGPAYERGTSAAKFIQNALYPIDVLARF